MVLTSPKWYAAIYLDERIERLRGNDLPASFPSESRDRAKRYVEKWRTQSPFNSGDYFSQRLNLLGVTEGELLDLLSQPLEVLQGHYEEAPEWLKRLEGAFSQYDLVAWLQWRKTLTDDRQAGFLDMVAPLIQDAMRRLHGVVEELAAQYARLPFATETVEQLLARPIFNGLMTMISRVAVQELQVAAFRKLLSGDTPTERFDSFIRLLGEKEISLEILSAYPVLTARIITYLDQWVNTRTEFLQRLCADQEELQQQFATNGEEIGYLAEVRGELGDRHRGGHTVIIATFSSGLRLVYKPKPLHADARFQDLLAWFNEAHIGPEFRLARLLTRERYGWIEFFETAECHSTAEVQRFYFRMGAFLAILYTLEGADFHAENIIAVGEHPLLIDLESLFHVLFINDEPNGTTNWTAEQRVRASVLKVGLLPQKIWGNKDGVAIDVSGLGAPRKQQSPRKTLVWENPGTDQMRPKFETVDFDMKSQNRPILNGQDVRLGDYIEDICTGFSAFYRYMSQHRQVYNQRINELFSGLEVRILVRPTQLYNMLLQQSYHPDNLSDALSLNHLYDKLWLDVRRNAKYIKVIPSEIYDLRQGDIPMFTTFSDSLHLWNSRGQKISHVFRETGLQLAQQRIAQLTETDLRDQEWLIRSTMASMGQPQPKPLRMEKASVAGVQERLLTTACQIADHLETSAIGYGEDVSWMVFSNTPYGWNVSLSDLNMYDGLGGIAFFLAYLGQATAESRYTQLAERAINSLRRHVPVHLPTYEPIGGFEGWGSVIYSLTHLGALWNRLDLWEEAEQIAHALPRHIGKDNRLDVIAGASGCIAALLNLSRVQPSAQTIAVAQLCGEHLLSQAERMPVGVGWKNHIATKLPLTGFSHGTAGMAWALLQLAAVTGDSRFRQTALDAIAYERSLYVPESANWRDLRLAQRTNLHPEQCQCGMAWCHGAPGIGLGRLLGLAYLDNKMVRQEIETAVHTTLTQGFGAYHPGFGQNYSLCHGDLGNMDTLLEIYLRLENYAHLEEPIYHFSAVILDSMETYGWLSGVPQGLQTPGLMTGIAGMGYELLRLAKPHQTPSVLGLQPPLVRH